jgi:hypothetical protein
VEGERPVCGGVHKGVPDRDACGMYMRGRVGQREVEMLIDSGANISIIGYDIYMNMMENRPILQRYGIPMVTADGTPMKVYGCADFKLEIGDEWCTYDQQMCIADVGVDMILGYDFLKKYEAVIDMGRSVLELKDLSTEGQVSKEGGQKECNVVIGRTITVPAGGEAMAQGYCVGNPVAFTGIIEPHPRFLKKHCMLLASAVVRAGHGVPVRIFNVGDKPVTIYKDTMAATCRAVEVMRPDEARMTKQDETSCVGGLPEHLEQLYSKGCQNLDEVNQRKLKELLIEYEEVFSAHDLDMGKTGLIRHSIDTRDAHPVKQRLRRVPLHLKNVVKSEMHKLLEKELIEPSISPWASSLVLVKKKLPDKHGAIQYRVCIDYRPLNEVTIKDSYPTKKCEECLDALIGSKWYCSMDLMSGYHQVEMDPRDKEKTAFHTEDGLFQWTVMSMGLANSSATFNRVLEQILTGIPPELCVIYIDDILVHAPSCDQMFLRLRIVLNRIKEAGLKFKTGKCSLFGQEVLFLGHHVSSMGIKPDPGKTEAILNWERPRCVKDVRSFLGTCGYYRRFVEKFADIARPLYKLTEKENLFIWSEGAERAFVELKERLCGAPILVYPDISKSFILDCDASNEGLGAVLSQKDVEGVEHPVAYYARAFSKVEKRYCVTRRELLACVGAIRHFHHYLLGARFTVRTDHNSLIWLCHFRELDGQLARWLETLAQYDFEIIHRKGKQHGNADGLSRRPCLEERCKHCEKAELIEYNIQYVSAAVDWVSFKDATQEEVRGTASDWEVCGEPPGGGELVTMTTGEQEMETHGPSVGWEDPNMGVSEPSGIERECEPKSIDEDTKVHEEDKKCEDVIEKCAGIDDNSGVEGDDPERGCAGMRDERVVSARIIECGGDEVWHRLVAAIDDQGRLDSELGARDNLITEQRLDDDIRLIVETLDKKLEKPKVCDISRYGSEFKRYWGQWDSLRVMGGVLYRKFETEDGTSTHWQVIMPKTLRNSFLERVHCDKTAGHLGIDKTRRRVQQRAYWFGWRTQVAMFCQKCVLCASRKPPPRKYRAPMQQHLTGVPMERVSMDVLGPLPKSDSNNKFVLLVCDYFTKWVEAFPMPNQEAKTVADLFVKEFVCRYGVPRKLFSDQGSNFQSNLFREVCKLLDIEKSRTTPYHPQSDGLVERMNRTIEAMISMYISPGQRDWDEYLPYIMMAYRSAVQSTTGYTPNKMMLGREVELPIDLIIGVPEDKEKKVSGVEYVEKLRVDLEQVHAVAREHIKCRSDRQKRNYDVKTRMKRYEECDLVWLHNPAKKKGISPKLTRSWEGPYMVIHRLSDVTYRIKGGLRAKLKIVHFDRLKPYHGESVPDWVQQ